MTTQKKQVGRAPAIPYPTMSMWTIYNRPKDYPKDFVARRSVILHAGVIGPTDDMFTAKTLDEIRALLPRGLYRLDRQPGDDAKIVEVWL